VATRTPSSKQRGGPFKALARTPPGLFLRIGGSDRNLPRSSRLVESARLASRVTEGQARRPGLPLHGRGSRSQPRRPRSRGCLCLRHKPSPRKTPPKRGSLTSRPEERHGWPKCRGSRVDRSAVREDRIDPPARGKHRKENPRQGTGEKKPRRSGAKVVRFYRLSALSLPRRRGRAQGGWLLAAVLAAVILRWLAFSDALRRVWAARVHVFQQLLAIAFDQRPDNI